ncbi:MAG: hypothetical protein JXR13_04390 [Thalassovita sp.]
MSFYFTIATPNTVSPEDLLSDLNMPQVEYRYLDANGTAVFYIPGSSFRGAVVYRNEEGFEVAVNAFTPSCDAVLARDIAASIADLTEANVHPEDSEIEISAQETTQYGGDEWVIERWQEAFFMLQMAGGEDVCAPGYRLPFLFSPLKAAANGASHEKILRQAIADAIELQDLPEKVDIDVREMTTLEVKSSTTEQLIAKLFGKPKKPREKRVIYSLEEGRRSLTPANVGQDRVMVVIGNARKGLRMVPGELLNQTARSLGAREYGLGVFDLTLTGQAYWALFAKGTRF